MSEHLDDLRPDEQLGRLLDAVELEHAPDYWDRLRDAVTPSLGALRRPPLWARRRFQLAVGLAAAAACVTLVLVGLPGGKTSFAPAPADAARLMAARLAWGMRAMSSVQGDFAETVTVRAPGHAPASAEWRGSFAADASGDSRYQIALIRRSAEVGMVAGEIQQGPAVLRSDRPHGVWAVLQPTRYVSVYDARTLAARWAAWDAAGHLTDHGSAHRWPVHGIWPWPDDLLYFCSDYLAEAALLQDAVAGQADLKVQTGRYEGRPAWQATIDLGRLWYPKRDFYTALRETVTVDQSSGLIVRTVLDATPGPASAEKGFPYATSPYTIDLRVSGVKTDSELPAGTFTTLPAGVPNPAPSGVVSAPGNTVTSVTLAQAVAAVGFKPLVPSSVPSGFVLSGISTDARTGIGSMLQQFAVMPEVDQLYRRGLEWFELDVCQLNSKDAGFPVPVLPPLPRRVALHGGHMKGLRAYVQQEPSMGNGSEGFFSDHGLLPFYVLSFVDCLGRGYCIHVSGNVSTQTMLAIANSLTVYRG
jgi:hypothetical protein